MSRHTVTIDVDLDELDIGDVVGYLRGRGYVVSGPTGNGTLLSNAEVDNADLNRVFTLSVAGQADAARDLALRIVGDSIGRAL